MRTPSPPYDLGPGLDLTLYVSPEPFKKKVGEMPDTFFCRKLPWKAQTSPTKISLVVSMIAAKAVVTRVEPDLEMFLATGVMKGGADKLNREARAKGGQVRA